MDVPLAPGEFRDRVFSRLWDQHQPNILRFLLGKNSQFSLRHCSPGTLWRLRRERAVLDAQMTRSNARKSLDQAVIDREAADRKAMAAAIWPP